jgi:hypothetical protein
MKRLLKHIIIICCLLIVNNCLHAQIYSLKTKVAETDLKIICDSAYFFMDRNDIITMLKKMEKTDKVKYTMPIKKMNGVCFEAINLRKPNEDKDIVLVQQLFLNKIIHMAIMQKKVAIKWKKSTKYLTAVNESMGNKISCGSAESYQSSFHHITDDNGAIIFTIN